MPLTLRNTKLRHLQKTKKNKEMSKFIRSFIQKGALIGALFVFPVITWAETFQVVYHVVETGETLSSLSSQFDVSVADIRKLNNISGSNIQLGQKLLIPTNRVVTVSKSKVGSSSVELNKIQTKLSKEQKQYTVVSGDTLSTIAVRHKISLASLLKANNISADYPIKSNQQLVIPINTSSNNRKTSAIKIATHKSNNNSKKYSPSVNGYKVKSGDILLAIANANNVEVADIMELNGMTSDFLKAGQILKIPKSSSRQTNKSNSPSAQIAQSSITHTVQSGDVLSTIADTYGVSLTQIIKLNNLENNQDQLKIGQILKLPSNAKINNTGVQSVQSKPRIRDTVNKAVGSTGY